MKEQKNNAAPVIVEKKEAAPKTFTIPKTVSIKKEVVIKYAIIIVVALALLPVLDWVVQTSIVSKYAAFYKNADVTRSQYVQELEKQYGGTVANELLAKAAITQAAKEKGITVTDAEVESAVTADKAKAGITSDEAFASALASSNITEADYRAYIKITVTLDKLLAGSVTEPTDKEVQDYYTQNKATTFSGKKLEDVKATIIAALKEDNLNTLRQNWITQALANYSKDNLLVGKEQQAYKFGRSLDLVKRLFSSDPTK